MKKKKLLIVMDTNVLISGLGCPGGNEGQILDKVRRGQIGLALSPDLFGEYLKSTQAALVQINRMRTARQLRKLSATEARRIVRALLNCAAIGEPSEEQDRQADTIVKQRKDAKVAAIALLAETVIVSGNVKDFKPGMDSGMIVVIEPATFAGLLSLGLI